MLTTKLNKQKGQGLIETLIAAVIIISCVVALIRFQSRLAYHDSYTQQQSHATILALSKIESLRDFNVLNNQSPYTSYQGIASGTSTYTGTATTYTLTWTVTTVASPSYKTIDVTVSWTDRYGATQSVRLITNVAGIEPAYSATVMY